VLVLDGSLRQALVATRSLGRSGLVIDVAASAAASSVPAFASHWCRRRLQLPSAADSGEQVYLAALLEELAAAPPRVLLASSDGTVSAMRTGRRQLEQLTRLALAAEPALAITTDKAQTLAVATQLGIPVPRGAEVADLADVPAVLAETGLPAVVKPVESWVVRTGGAVRVLPQAARTADEVRMVLEPLLRIGTRAVVQQWLPGRREAVHLLSEGGRPIAVFACFATRTHPPLGGGSVTRESMPLTPELASQATRIVERCGLDGYAEVEFRRDAEGRACLMEINPRLSAAVEVAVRAGVDFPLLLARWALGEPLRPVTTYRSGVRMRWLGGDLRWLRDAFRNQGQPDIPEPLVAARVFLGDFARRSGYDYWAFGDPRPALVAAAGASVRRGFRRSGSGAHTA
jgi:predicted ATP-grasp superfamily ATP-dependent carboligase